MHQAKGTYQEWIAKYLSREITAEEQELLSAWLNENPEHRQLFEQFQKAWNSTEELHASFEPDVDAAWNKLKHRIGQGQTVNVKKGETTLIKLWPPSFLKIAASIALILAVSGIALYFLKSTRHRFVEVASQDTRTLFILPDSSHVWLQPHSTLSYSHDFGKQKRDVKLNGEGFFDVKRDEATPFIVVGQKTQVRVLGTSFVVHARQGDEKEFVVVASGKVQFGEATNPANAVVLTKGDEASFLPEKPLDVRRNASQNAVAWKTNRLQFDNTSLQQVLDDLELYFDIQVRTDNPALLKCQFTGTFELPSAEEVLNLVCLSLNSSYKKDGKTYTLHGLGCP